MNAAKLLQRHENLEAIRGENIFLTHEVIECIGSGNNLVFKVKNNESGEFRAVKEIVIAFFMIIRLWTRIKILIFQ